MLADYTIALTASRAPNTNGRVEDFAGYTGSGSGCFRFARTGQGQSRRPIPIRESARTRTKSKCRQRAPPQTNCFLTEF
jgi:hypothetical protein